MAYVYCHIRIDKEEPFYIGIGTDNINYKRAKERARRSKFWKKIVSKTNYKVEILFDNLTWEEAKIKEVELILKYGRKDIGNGTLVNMTDGGDGTINKVFDDNYRKKLSIAAKKRDNYKNYEKMQEGRKNFKVTDEYRQKLSNAHTGKKKTQNQIDLSRKRMLTANPSKGKLGIESINFKGQLKVFKEDQLIGVFDGVMDASRKLNLIPSKISAVLNKRRNHTGGYYFERID
jgi:hypothetical protein